MTDRPTDRQAAERIAALLYDHREDALTCYDHGGYCCVCGVHDMAGYRWHLAEVIAADASSEADGLGGWWRDTPEARAALDEERLDLLLSEFYHSDDDDYVAALGDLKKFLATHVAAAREADRAEVVADMEGAWSIDPKISAAHFPEDGACPASGVPVESCDTCSVLTAYAEREQRWHWNLIREQNAIRSQKAAEERLAEAEALREAADDVLHQVRRFEVGCEADAGYYDAHMEIAKHLRDRADEYERGER